MLTITITVTKSLTNSSIALSHMLLAPATGHLVRQNNTFVALCRHDGAVVFAVARVVREVRRRALVVVLPADTALLVLEVATLRTVRCITSGLANTGTAVRFRRDEHPLPEDLHVSVLGDFGTLVAIREDLNLRSLVALRRLLLATMRVLVETFREAGFCLGNSSVHIDTLHLVFQISTSLGKGKNYRSSVLFHYLALLSVVDQYRGS